MKKITLTRQEHRGEMRIMLRFDYDRELIDLVKTIDGALWSKTQGCWHVPDGDNIVGEFFKLFRGKAYIDYTALRSSQPDGESDNEIQSAPSPVAEEGLLTPEEEAKIENFRLYMAQRRYASSTVRNYISALETFLRHIKPREAKEVDRQDVSDFIHSYILRNGLSNSYQNIVLSALKLFYREVFRTKLDVELIERPRREKKLPNVLGKEEMKKILEAPGNLKHRTMLALIYSCGLRRSELLNLSKTDIDKDRGVLIIRQSKGNKDRVVPLSKKVVEMLEEYYLAFRPLRYVFEGQTPGQKYSATSVEKVLERACEKAGIDKPVTLHWLRHSYATHLLESGVDIRYIQEILGHKSTKTTEIYTHVSFKSLQNIKSPFDDL